MRWSFKVARLAGIDIYIHFTFLLLLGFLGFHYYAARQSVSDAVWGVVFILAIFATVVLHELGHALTARRFGVQTRDITLLPIGGVARLDRIPEEPTQELLVAVAGPLVNVVIAAVLFVGILATGGFNSAEDLTRDPSGLGWPFAQRLFVVNVLLVVFNLIPAFPMDGGRILRAFLAMNMDYAQATNVAALIGQAIAFVFGAIGLFTGNLILMLIALFVWIGAAGEASVAQMRAAIAGIPVRKAMILDFTAVGPADSLRLVADHVMDGYQSDFPVIDDGKVVGILRLSDLLGGLSAAGLDAPVSRFMRTDFGTAAPGEALDQALSRLQTGECPVMPVIDRDGKLAGLLTPDNVGELVMIRQAVRARRDRVPRPLTEPPPAEAVPGATERP